MTESTPGAGHNSGVAADELRQFIERIERLEEEKKEVCEQVKEVYTELKGRGFDSTAIRSIVKMRKADREKLSEQHAVVELYCKALGMENFLT